ncbi:MAG: hypothetical protein H0W23_04085 [Chloroflexia bacterium]|nr:hypothetical protein [Chloroflexia bacterium]
MAKKAPGKPAKTWAPGDPLNLDKAIRHDAPDSLGAGKRDVADDALFSRDNTVKKSFMPVSQKVLNRHQKKG